MTKRRVRFRESAVIGWNPIAAVVDVATSAVDGAVDVATSVIDAVPGGSFIKDGVNTVTGPVGDFIKGPLRDFSRTGVGEVVTRAFSVAVSSAAYMLAPGIGPFVFAWVGPTLAFAAFSIPGLAKGEPFDEALVKEFAWRVAYVVGMFSKQAGEEVAKYLGPLMSKQLTKALDEGKRILKEKFPGVDGEELFRQAGITPESVAESWGLTPRQLAAKLGIREDVAAAAVAWMRRDPKLLERIKGFDPITGKDPLTAIAEASDEARKRRAETVRALRIQSQTDPCGAWIRSIHALAPEDIHRVDEFKAYCQNHKNYVNELARLASIDPCKAYLQAVANVTDNPNWEVMLKAKCAAHKTKQAVNFTIAQKEEASAKATRNYALLGAGILLAAGGAVWYLKKRGK